MKMRLVAIAVLALFIISSCGGGSYDPSLVNGDWPQYRADAGRTGYSPGALPADLSLKWKLEQHAPTPAWLGVHTRMAFDYAYHPVIGGNTLYYGSSADCQVHAVDAVTGQEKWTFFTGSPVRFAPALYKDKVYAVSDDGNLYCLSAKDGKELWRYLGGPDSAMILGNDRMTSKWPARGGAVVKDDVVYFGAGIWPSEGIYIYALDPDTGEALWINDDSGGMQYKQPHGGAESKSGISSQGYLVAAGENLFIPTGRSVPAALDLATGDFNYFHLQKHRAYGGSRVSATDDFLFATSGNTRYEWENIGRKNAIFNNADGELVTNNEMNSPALAITPEYAYYIDSKDRNLKAIKTAAFIESKEVKNRKGETVIQKNLGAPAWTVDTREDDAVTMIVVGDKIVSGSINGKITVIDSSDQSVVWSEEVDGVPYGLAAAHGCLYVSTDKGTMYCFDGSGTTAPKVITQNDDNNPYGKNEMYAQAAREIIASSGITEGYCLDLGCGDGNLAYELAKSTNLTILAIEADPNTAQKAREKLAAAGLYGTRVTVHVADPSSTDYPEYFANLVVSGRAVVDGANVVNRDEAYRLQRPYGGTICIGKPGGMEQRLREELPGAGDWTSLYSDPANTTNSLDELVKGELGMLWFRDSDFEMPSRHGRGVAPLVSQGRLFVQGNHGIRAYDAYNGTILWEYYIEDLMKAFDQEHLLGAATTHGNWCIDGDRLYVRVSQQMASATFRSCLAIDVATGKLVKRYGAPAGLGGDATGYWGYLSVEDGTIYGTIVNDQHITKWGYLESNMSNLFSESQAIFALDADSGDMKWMYKAKNSIRHNAIAIGGGRVYLIDRPIFKGDHLFSGSGRSRGAHSDTISHPSGTLIALDTETGKVLASNRKNIFGTLLALSTENDMLLMTYQYTRFKLPSEVGGRMAGYRVSDLRAMWDIPTGIKSGSGYGYSSRPILNGDRVYFEPFAFDIATGEKLDFLMKRTYNCGIISSAKNMMLYRSGTLGYLDLNEPQEGTQDFGGIRPGCWINAIPAGGLVLMPDATARCNCSYLIKATIALKPGA